MLPQLEAILRASPKIRSFRIIDNDWVIDHLANIPKAVSLLDRLAQEGIAISIITYMEAYQGVLRSPNPEEAQSKLRAFATAFLLVPNLSFAQANPCAAKNPCAAQNPCAANNPCAVKGQTKGKAKKGKSAKAAENPCAANPCATKKW